MCSQNNMPPMHSSHNASSAANMTGNVKPINTLHGVWRKDYKSSDLESMRMALDCMQLSKMQKVAAMNFVNGLRVELGPSQETAKVQFLATVPFYKVTEEYKRGEETTMKRRDLRRGEQRATAVDLRHDAMHVDLQWDGYLPGKVSESFVVNSRGQLVVRGIMQVNGQVFDIRTVYNKEDC
jgi:hypothetical protein